MEGNKTDKIYKLLNAKQPRTLIFQLTKRGFASEINNMLLAILYCLVHNIRFVLYSRGWCARHDKGWNDYFLPFCKEYSNILFHKSSVDKAFYKVSKYKRLYYLQEIFLNMNNHMSVVRVWHDMRNATFTSGHFNIPELDINGDIFHAKSILLAIIYNYNDEITKTILTHDKLLNDIQPYLSVHIRRGDKIATKEAEEIKISEYIEKIKTFDINNIFIATDDYRVIDSFKETCPHHWNIVTFCKSGKAGYSQGAFCIADKDEKRRHMIDLFVDIHFMIKSQFFIGTYSSNIGRLIALIKGQKNCYSLDNEWIPE